MTKFQRKIIIGQILGVKRLRLLTHIEKIKTNCRMSFSFGSNYQINGGSGGNHSQGANGEEGEDGEILYQKIWIT